MASLHKKRLISLLLSTDGKRKLRQFLEQKKGEEYMLFWGNIESLFKKPDTVDETLRWFIEYAEDYLDPKKKTRKQIDGFTPSGKGELFIWMSFNFSSLVAAEDINTPKDLAELMITLQDAILDEMYQKFFHLPDIQAQFSLDKEEDEILTQVLTPRTTHIQSLIKEELSQVKLDIRRPNSKSILKRDLQTIYLQGFNPKTNTVTYTTIMELFKKFNNITKEDENKNKSLEKSGLLTTPITQTAQNQLIHLILLPDFACGSTRKILTDASKTESLFKQLGVETVIVGCGTYEEMMEFYKSNKNMLSFGHLYTDPSLALYNTLGCRRTWRGSFEKRPQLMSQTLTQMGFWRIPFPEKSGVKAGGGDGLQLGGVYLVSFSGDVAYYNISKYRGDIGHSYNAMLRLCGASEQYLKDNEVITKGLLTPNRKWTNSDSPDTQKKALPDPNNKLRKRKFSLSGESKRPSFGKEKEKEKSKDKKSLDLKSSKEPKKKNKSLTRHSSYNKGDKSTDLVKFICIFDDGSSKSDTYEPNKLLLTTINQIAISKGILLDDYYIKDTQGNVLDISKTLQSQIPDCTVLMVKK